MIAAHRVDRDFYIAHEDLFLSRFDDFPFLVVAAMGASAMRHAQLVAVGTLRKRSRGQVIVRPATIAARL
jgi:hypothetical protein